MKTNRYPLVGVAAVLFATLSLAGEPAEPGKETQRGRALVLLNERVLLGEVERVGDRYHVRREIGSTWVPTDQALHLCDSLEEAFTFLRGRANLEDPDERLRLADWCRLNGLNAQALEEARAAQKLRPDHTRTRLLVRLLEERLRSPRPAARPPAPVEEPGPSFPVVDVDVESLTAFATRVQPILMNTCLRCHASGRGGKFHLQRVASPGLTNRRSTQYNLAAVLEQVDYRHPDASPVLVKAVSDHAQTGRAPLGGREESAFLALQGWLVQTLKNNPQLARQVGAVEVRPGPVKPPPPVFTSAPESRVEWGEARTVPGSAAAALPASGTHPPAPSPAPGPRDLPIWAQAFRPGQTPSAPPETPGGKGQPTVAVTAGRSADPYDPAAFNGQATGETPTPGPTPAPAVTPPAAPPPRPLPASVNPELPGTMARPATPTQPPPILAPYSPGGPWQVGVVRPGRKTTRPSTGKPSDGRNP